MNTRFNIFDTPLNGLMLIERKPIGDTRGFLERLFCQEEFKELLSGKGIIQINHTLTAKKGTVRGMHFQKPPHCESKIVSCLRGKVFDVAVDVREKSPTFLQSHAEILSANNHKTFLLPEGFAHGFQALEDDCEMLYFHTAAYQPAAEIGLHVQDPRLAIHWPLPVIDLSHRDASHPFLSDDFCGVKQ